MILLAVVVFDTLLLGGIFYYFSTVEAQRAAAAALPAASATPTATATATLWPGPPPTLTRTPTLPPTPAATDVLAEGGFPFGFTPTPFPTREQVMITLPRIYPVFRSKVDVPIINQIHYPEPFFPPGTNNACGPVALFAALHGLGANVNYGHLRNVAVSYGFTDYGISKSGMIHTVTTLNQELGNPFVITYGNNYATKDLIKEINRGGIVIVLIRVRKVGGQFVVTSDLNNSFGHFLVVDSINLGRRTVNFAGSTLGMKQVPLTDFMASWASNPQAVSQEVPPTLRGLVRIKEKAVNWALIIRRPAS